MKQLKNRTLALVLASVITVVGTFGAENYKNSLMSLQLDSEAGGATSVTLFTKLNDSTPVNPIKKDANTYVIMLPETEAKNAQVPEISGNVESIDIKTMPYTTNGKGYTKITIKTTTNTLLNAKKMLYIAEQNSSEETFVPTPTAVSYQEPTNIRPENEQRNYNPPPERPVQNNYSDDKPDIQKSVQQFQTTPPEVNELSEKTDEIKPSDTPNNPDDTSDNYIGILCVLLAIISIVYIFIKSNNKMAEIVGEKLDISIDDDVPAKKEKSNKRKQIKNTIRTLDKMYEKPLKMPLNIPSTEDMPELEQNTNPEAEAVNSMVVDLDELFQEQKNNTETDTNDALDDFLNAFNFEAEEISVNQEEDNKIEELFDKYIQNGNINFSNDDIEKINKLLHSEINDETIKNISQYAATNPIKNNKPNHSQILEDFITAYTINQNISFTDEDVKALNKLISVELDNDFISDLTTNPERAATMRQEIESRHVVHKSREILTLNVKDMLPDLSEALKKQGGKRIESEVKPEVVYYSEGYDVNTLSVNEEDLPDLTLDFDNPEYKKYRPSDQADIVASGYEFETLAIKDELPDLKDAAAHPEKYNQKKEAVKIDEEALLRNISNVTFKPFYDGYESIEISNNFDNEELNSEDNITAEQNEQITAETSGEEPVENKEEKTEVELPVLKKKNINIKNRIKDNSNAQKLLNIISEQQRTRTQKNNEQKVNEKIDTSNDDKAENVTLQYKTCMVEGEKFEIVNSANITETVGCYLAKNAEGYSVLGYIGGKVFKIKYYEKLNSERIQVRLNEKVDNETSQYIIRIGRHKFLINVTENNMEYIMDLC